MEDLPILIRAAGNFVKNPNKPDPVHAPIFYTNAKMYLAELSGMFVDHRIYHASEFVAF